MNFMKKSTDGFSIGNVLLDFCGGMTNYCQMVTQSIDQSLSFFPSNSLYIVTCQMTSCIKCTECQLILSFCLSRFLGEFLWQHWKSIVIFGMY